MSVSIWQQGVRLDAMAPADYECDVVVIGAGIVGAYTAHTLAVKGKKVALLEARFPAAGATGRNAGFCMRGGSTNYAASVEQFGRETTREVWQLSTETQRKTRAFVERFKTHIEPGRGTAILACDDSEADALEHSATMMREDGLQVEFRAADPYERGFRAALLQPDDFGLQPAELVRALIENASGNLRFFAPAEVFAITPDALGLLVEARTVSVRCQQVALCTNAYTPMLLHEFADKVAPTRGQVFVTAPLKRRVLDRLCSANFGYEYFRQLENGCFLLGGGRLAHKEREVGYDETPSEWVQHSLQEFMSRYFPDVLAEAPIIRRWAGIMAFSPDGMPLVGRVPAIPDLHFAVAMTGHGMGWGIAAADLMLAQMAGERSDAGPFDARRFDKVMTL